MLLSGVSQLRNSREFGNVALAGSRPSVWKERPEITSLPSLEEPFWSSTMPHFCGELILAPFQRASWILPLLGDDGFNLCFSYENMGIGRILGAICLLWKGHV